MHKITKQVAPCWSGLLCYLRAVVLVSAKEHINWLWYGGASDKIRNVPYLLKRGVSKKRKPVQESIQMMEAMGDSSSEVPFADGMLEPKEQAQAFWDWFLLDKRNQKHFDTLPQQ